MTDDDRPSGAVLTRREVLALLGVGGFTALAAGRRPGPAGRDAHLRGAARPDRGSRTSWTRSSTARTSAPIRRTAACGPARRCGSRCASRASPAAPARRCPAPRWTSGTATRSACTPTCRTRAEPRSARSSCAATRPPTATAWSASPRSIRARTAGRAVHIHFKVRTAAGGGRVHDFTSQLFFDDALSDQVFAQPPYVGRAEQRLRNAAGRHLPQRGRPAHARGDARRARLRGHVRSRARDGLESRRDALPDHEGRPGLHGAARGGRRVRLRPFLRDVRELPRAGQGGGPRRHRPPRARRGGDRGGSAGRGGAPRSRPPDLRGRAPLRRRASGGAARASHRVPARALGRLLRPPRRALALEQCRTARAGARGLRRSLRAGRAASPSWPRRRPWRRRARSTASSRGPTTT